MSDIIERLRIPIRQVSVCDEAADEIERLRASRDEILRLRWREIDDPGSLVRKLTAAEAVVEVAREAYAVGYEGSSTSALSDALDAYDAAKEG